MREPWYESENPSTVVRGGSWRIGLWIIGVIVFCLIVGAGLWSFGVFTSDIKGRGDAIKEKNSATNRINKQERFEDMYADILASDQRLDVLAKQVALDPKSQVAQTNFTGATTYCIQVVNDYNAEARKYTAEAFRAADLPAKIDQQDPATDCKETIS